MASALRFAVTRIPDPSWGSPLVARAVASEKDFRGPVGLLEDTPWEKLVPVIPWDVYDQALRGRATPLMRLIGPPPEALAKKLRPPIFQSCKLRGGCINSSPSCIPGLKMPDCWEAEGLLDEASKVASQVARFWRDGILVVAVLPEG